MAVDMFLKIDGVDGESSSIKHKGEIEILSFSWGVTNTGSHSGGGGGGAGKTEVKDFSIVKAMGPASPVLMEKCCTGQHIPDVTITLVNKEKGDTFYVIKLSDCLISSYQTAGNGAGGAPPMDEVSFNFTRMELQSSGKNGGTQVSCGFGKLGEVNGEKHNH